MLVRGDVTEDVDILVPRCRVTSRRYAVRVKVRRAGVAEAEAEHAFRIGTGPNPYLVLSSGRRSLARKKARDGEDEARKIYGRFQRRYPHARVPLIRLELDHLERPFTRVA